MSLEDKIERLTGTVETLIGILNAQNAQATIPADDHQTRVVTTPEDAAPQDMQAATLTLAEAQSALGLEAQRLGGGAQIIALIGQYGASKLTDVDPSKYAEIVAKAKQLQAGAA